MSHADKQHGWHGDETLNPRALVSFDVCRFRLHLSCPITHNLSNGRLFKVQNKFTAFVLFNIKNDTALIPHECYVLS